MHITKREILFSVIIVLLMIFLGFIISEKIYDSILEENELYYKAVKIDSNPEQFTYGMKTSIGNALVYGDFKSVGEATIPELNNGYFSIEKITERYTRHTRTVSTTINGKTTTRVEVYHTWDFIDSNIKEVKEVTFLGQVFPTSKFSIKNDFNLSLNKDTVSQQYLSWVDWDGYMYNNGDKWANVGDLRFMFYVIPTEFNGSILANLKDNTVYNVKNSEKSVSVIYNRTISETIADKQASEENSVKIFWVLWIMLTIAGVIGFYYLDNYWLEDNRRRYKYY